jgi:hypothetical protein
MEPPITTAAASGRAGRGSPPRETTPARRDQFTRMESETAAAVLVRAQPARTRRGVKDPAADADRPGPRSPARPHGRLGKIAGLRGSARPRGQEERRGGIEQHEAEHDPKMWTGGWMAPPAMPPAPRGRRKAEEVHEWPRGETEGDAGDDDVEDEGGRRTTAGAAPAIVMRAMYPEAPAYHRRMETRRRRRGGEAARFRPASGPARLHARHRPTQAGRVGPRQPGDVVARSACHRSPPKA